MPENGQSAGCAPPARPSAADDSLLPRRTKRAGASPCIGYTPVVPPTTHTNQGRSRPGAPNDTWRYTTVHDGARRTIRYDAIHIRSGCRISGTWTDSPRTSSGTEQRRSFRRLAAQHRPVDAERSGRRMRGGERATSSQPVRRRRPHTPHLAVSIAGRSHLCRSAPCRCSRRRSPHSVPCGGSPGEAVSAGADGRAGRRGPRSAGWYSLRPDPFEDAGKTRVYERSAPGQRGGAEPWG